MPTVTELGPCGCCGSPTGIPCTCRTSAGELAWYQNTRLRVLTVPPATDFCVGSPYGFVRYECLVLPGSEFLFDILGGFELPFDGSCTIGGPVADASADVWVGEPGTPGAYILFRGAVAGCLQTADPEAYSTVAVWASFAVRRSVLDRNAYEPNRPPDSDPPPDGCVAVPQPDIVGPVGAIGGQVVQEFAPGGTPPLQTGLCGVDATGPSPVGVITASGYLTMTRCLPFRARGEFSVEVIEDCHYSVVFDPVTGVCQPGSAVQQTRTLTWTFELEAV